MKYLTLNLHTLDCNGFHDTLARILGFPRRYERNRDTTIKCLKTIADSWSMNSSVKINKDDYLIIRVQNVLQSAISVLDEMIVSIKLVNNYFAANNLKTRILLEFENQEEISMLSSQLQIVARNAKK